MISDQTAPQPRGWPLFLAGVIVFLLGLISNVVQLAVLQITTMPWALLILTTVGALLMVASLVVRFSVMRAFGSVVFLVLTVVIWVFMLVIARTPDYTGPAQVDSAVPAFEVALADGKMFSSRDFADGEGTILLFNRGRW
jgi:uncharacterized membrane protein